jgi:hypothetical protein
MLHIQEKTAWMTTVMTPKSEYFRSLTIFAADLPGQDQLFLLPNGEPASFFLHNFENVGLTKKIIVSYWLAFSWVLGSDALRQVHGGLITVVDTSADVILTKSRTEYGSLKDRFAISRKTHVRLSGFVDRCIDSHRFQLEPIVEKGVPGRRPMSR